MFARVIISAPHAPRFGKLMVEGNELKPRGPARRTGMTYVKEFGSPATPRRTKSRSR